MSNSHLPPPPPPEPTRQQRMLAGHLRDALETPADVAAEREASARAMEAEIHTHKVDIYQEIINIDTFAPKDDQHIFLGQDVDHNTILAVDADSNYNTGAFGFETVYTIKPNGTVFKSQAFGEEGVMVGRTDTHGQELVKIADELKRMPDVPNPLADHIAELGQAFVKHMVEDIQSPGQGTKSPTPTGQKPGGKSTELPTK